MNMIEVVFTTDAAGAAAGTTLPVRGELAQVRVPNAGTAWMGTGSTADITITRLVDGGTLLALTNGQAPWEYNPRTAAHSLTAGTSAYAVGVGPVLTDPPPVYGPVVVTVAQAQFSKAGTVYLWIDD